MAAADLAWDRDRAGPSSSGRASSDARRWTGLPLAVAVGLAHLGFGVLVESATVEAVIAFEAVLLAGVALVAALHAGGVGATGRLRRATVFAVGYGGTVAVAWLLTVRVSTLWVAVTSLLALLSVALYGLERYQLVALGLVGVEDA